MRPVLRRTQRDLNSSKSFATDRRTIAVIVFAALCLASLVSLSPVDAQAGGPDLAAPFFDRTGKLTAPPFRTLGDLQGRLKATAAGGNLETFWREVTATGQMPLVFGDTAVFLYRGKAAAVDWIGDFTIWQAGEPLSGQRVGKTDLWTAQRQFPRDARFDYKVRVDGQQRKDPFNPVTQLGGYGSNSVLTMPNYVYPQVTLPRQKSLKGTLGAPIVLNSKQLGYAKRVQIYTPAGFQRLTNLPVLYVTDGHEFANPAMGALPVILDNLIADGLLQPVIAVFVDPRAVDTGDNRRGPELLTNPRFQAFLTQELIPWVDSRYPTRPLRESRGLVGMSLGGLHATYTAMRQPEWFAFIGLLSPYYKAKPAVLAEVEINKRQPLKLFVSQGTFDYDIENTRHLREVLKAKGYQFKYIEVNDGHSWGNWRGVLDDMLLYFWGGQKSP